MRRRSNWRSWRTKCKGDDELTPISLSHPRVTSIQTMDGGEAMVSLHGMEAKLLMDDSAANIACLGYVPEFLLRESAARRLVAAAQSLPHALYLLVKETLRPASFQDFIFHRRLKRLTFENPNFSQEQLIELTSKFVAPPWVAGHPTGGALDITLCDKEGQEWDMGCSYDEDEIASQGRCFSFANNLTPQAQAHRRILFDCLNRQGFVNYPYEWWHWSYGDKYWAAMTNAPHAIYGAIG